MFLVSNFLILFAFTLTASAQVSVKNDLPVKNGERIFARQEKTSAAGEKNAKDTDRFNLKREFTDVTRRYFLKEKQPSVKSPAVLSGSAEDDFDRQTAETEDYRLVRGEKELVFEFGVSPFNPSNFAGPKEYDVYGRDLYQANFRIGRVIGTKGPVTYQYLFGATPLAVFSGNEVENPAYVSPQTTPGIQPTIRETTYGIGIQPVNFRFIFLPARRWKPYAQVGAGILITNEPIPVPRSQPFNLTGDFGGGLQYLLTKKRAVSFGYRYFHISNGNVGGKINNPGYNANVFFLGYSVFYGK